MSIAISFYRCSVSTGRFSSSRAVASGHLAEFQEGFNTEQKIDAWFAALDSEPFGQFYVSSVRAAQLNWCDYMCDSSTKSFLRCVKRFPFFASKMDHLRHLKIGYRAEDLKGAQNSVLPILLAVKQCPLRFLSLMVAPSSTDREPFAECLQSLESLESLEIRLDDQPRYNEFGCVLNEASRL